MTVISVFVPFLPAMPRIDIDLFGLNQAVSQGFAFGREMIFTFGPYSPIYTKAYHPSTDLMTLIGSLYLALSYWLSLILLMKNARWRWIIVFCVLLSSTIYLGDSLLFSYPLLAALASLKIVTSRGRLLASRRLSLIVVILLFAPFGLLTLIKGSILMICAIIMALCSLYFLLSKEKNLAIACLISPLASMVFFWIASGQLLVDLPNYFISMSPIVFGYTEAMALNGRTLEIDVYLISSVFLLGIILMQKQILGISKVFLTILFLTFLFLSFKGAFVRHDGHAIIAATSILIAACLLPFIIQSKLIAPMVAVALISCAYIDSHYLSLSIGQVYNHFISTYHSSWQGINDRFRNKNDFKDNFDCAMLSLKKQASFPILEGTTDIYSYDQLFLIASGNKWFPRPIFQSYSAYTPSLVEKNKNHLLSKVAPDNIIFKIESIDGRVPSLEDGASWPVLLAKYQPTQVVNGFLFLRKKLDTAEPKVPIEMLKEKHLFGEEVKVPDDGCPIFVEFDIKPSFFGRLANFFFKTTELQITFELKNGELKQYRLVPTMAKSGFLLSPLVETNIEFGLLYGGSEKNYLSKKMVASFSIAPSNKKYHFWKKSYAVTFKKIQDIITIDVSKLYKLDSNGTNLLTVKQQ